MARKSAINISGTSAAVLTDPTGALVDSGSMTNGQVIIGSTGATPVSAALTAGSGISITNGAGAITIAASGGSGALVNVQYLTAGSGTYTKTPGTNKILVMAVGGGGGGGGSGSFATSNLIASGRSGGGGAFCQRYYSTAPSTASYTVGSGGAGASAGSNAGSNGGSTSFNSDFTAGGGPGGAAGTTVSVPSGNMALFTTTSGGVPSGTYDLGYNGGASGIAFGGFPAKVTTGSGGGSFFGPGAQQAVDGNSSTANGFNASTPGTGGSGGCAVANNTARSGGNGADGLIIVYEFS